MFSKFKTFWQYFFESMRNAYNKTFKKPPESSVQSWRDITKINFLDIFVGKLNTLANTEATFDLVSTSAQTERLKLLCKNLEAKRSDITRNMLADGDYYVFPAHNRKGELIHTFLTQQQVRILDMDGEEITEAYGIINWIIDDNNRVYYLLRHHKLDKSGTLTISYSSIDSQGKRTIVPQWSHLADEAYSLTNANHIGFGRYKSPASGRGLSPVYGVPLNFGCAEIESKIFNDLKLIEKEFKNAQSKIFTDPRNLKAVKEDGEEHSGKIVGYEMPDNIIPIERRTGQTGAQIDIFSPTIRQSEHYAKLSEDMALYEKEVGTSRGILTENEATKGATATEVRRANADTLALIDDIHTAMDNGNRMTLTADSVYLNIALDLWAYSSSWFDPFEDPDAQWRRLVEAKSNNAAETADLIKWHFPKLTEDEVKEKIERINAEAKAATQSALDRLFEGE